jgi:hypothetical protein
MLKIENSIIFTCFEDDSYFSVLHLQTTNEFCFLLLQKGEQIVLMFLNALFLCVQPTLTDSERVFSVPGSFNTKIRSRKKFRVLNALVF